MDRALIVVALLLLAGCAKMPELDVTLGQHLPCSVGPVILHHGDQLTDPTGKEIAGLNNTGAALCGWTPPKKGSP